MKIIRTAGAILLLAALAAATGCKSEGGIRKYLPGFLKKKPAVVPTEEAFRADAEKYFLESGYEKIGDGRYRAVEPESGVSVTHALEWDPLRINEYPNRCWQGIVRRKIIRRIEDRDEIKESPFIMYWNSSRNRWEHLFGTDIPQPGE